MIYLKDTITIFEMDARRRSSVPGRVHTTRTEDADALAAMGHKQELQRNFSMISMLGLAFAILNTWTALAASLNLALPSGGPSAVIWGLITAGCFNLCLAASLAGKPANMAIVKILHVSNIST